MVKENDSLNHTMNSSVLSSLAKPSQVNRFLNKEKPGHVSLTEASKKTEASTENSFHELPFSDKAVLETSSVPEILDLSCNNTNRHGLKDISNTIINTHQYQSNSDNSQDTPDKSISTTEQ